MNTLQAKTLLESDKLTRQQQKSLFLWLGQCAEVLQNQGLDMRKTLIAPIIPTKESLLELVFRPIMTAMYGYKSTTELSKKDEIDSICDVIRTTFADMKIDLPQFPNAEEQNFTEIYKNN